MSSARTSITNEVTIYGERVEVKASVSVISGFSVHVGQSGLVNWYDSMAASKPKLILTHGEDDSRNRLATVLHDKYGVNALLPRYRETITVWGRDVVSSPRIDIVGQGVNGRMLLSAEIECHHDQSNLN